EKKSVSISRPSDTPAFSGRNSDRYRNTAPTLILSYEFSDSLNAYAKYARGWKSGGFNGAAASTDIFKEGYDPEKIAPWELGFKSRWLDKRLQLRGAVFLNDEKDIQLSVFTPSGDSVASSTIKNAGKSERKGAEL